MRHLPPRRPAAEAGFTLVELMVVVVILGLLATILSGNYANILHVFAAVTAPCGLGLRSSEMTFVSSRYIAGPLTPLPGPCGVAPDAACGLAQLSASRDRRAHDRLGGAARGFPGGDARCWADVERTGGIKR